MLADLVQDCSISSALAMEILQSCAKPSVCGIGFSWPYSCDQSSPMLPGSSSPWSAWLWPHCLQGWVSSKDAQLLLNNYCLTWGLWHYMESAQKTQIRFVYWMHVCCRIILKFRTEHGSITAVLCAKFQNDWARMGVIKECLLNNYCLTWRHWHYKICPQIDYKWKTCLLVSCLSVMQ